MHPHRYSRNRAGDTGDPTYTHTSTIRTGWGYRGPHIHPHRHGQDRVGVEHKPSSFPSCSSRRGSKDPSSEHGLLDTHVCFYSRQGHPLINFKTRPPFNADNQSSSSGGNPKISLSVQKHLCPGDSPRRTLEWAAIPFSRLSS